MERIKTIYQSLTGIEKKYLNTYLSAFHTKGENKALAVIDLLEANPNISQDEIANRLYGAPKSKAFLMLKAKLMERLMEVLTLSVNLNSSKEIKEDAPTYYALHLYKMLLHGMALRKRGLDDLAREVFTKCYKQAEAVSLPEIRLIALVKLRNIFPVEDADLGDHNAEIENALKEYETDIMGIGAWDEFRVINGMKTSSNQLRVGFLQTQTSLLKEKLEIKYSVRAEYYHLLLVSILHEIKEDYDQCKETLEELIRLIQTHEGLQGKNRLGVPYARLAELELKRKDFNAALDAAEKARTIFSKKRYNYLPSSIYKVYACIYTDRLTIAEKTIDELRWFTSRRQTHFASSILKYLSACIAYMRGDVRKSWKILIEVTDLHTDKEGWNAGIRIFEIMLLLDMEEADLVIAKLETLRKHISRYKVDKRSELIYRYLHQIEMADFDFGQSNPEMDGLLQQIRETSWELMGHEVIRFDTWVQSKLLGKAFYPCLLEQLNVPVGP